MFGVPLKTYIFFLSRARQHVDLGPHGFATSRNNAPSAMPAQKLRARPFQPNNLSLLPDLP
jgi:hypothetical protein